MRELLVEAAGVRVVAPAVGEEEAASSEPGSAAEAARVREREALDGARRRALLVAVLDGLAIAALLLLRQGDRFLVLSRNEETLFTLGVLVVAVHLGYRLAQAATVATVRRLHGELAEREE